MKHGDTLHHHNRRRGPGIFWLALVLNLVFRPVFYPHHPHMFEVPMRVLILTLILLSASLSPAFAASATIEGSWKGSGTISHRNNSDAVQCRVRFTKVGGASFEVASHCTTEGGVYDVTGRVNASGGGRYSGWVEGNGERGSVLMVQNGNGVSVTVRGGKGSAKLSLTRP